MFGFDVVIEHARSFGDLFLHIFASCLQALLFHLSSGISSILSIIIARYDGSYPTCKARDAAVVG